MPKDVMNEEALMRKTEEVRFRKPDASDGAAIWELIRACSPLDENSMYANLIQADHFSDTCVVAERGDKIVGWVSGHMIPNEESFFVWQVAVSEKARGLGLGKRMLRDLLDRDETEGAKALKTTITKDNDASWALFRSLARDIGGELTDEPHFEKDEHFDGAHDTEHMVTIQLDDEAARSAA
ncbi:diaminobutyrate acetyltransferase [Paracoccus sp. TK19116]|uniref:L-2,4-diaminobutyric acid acetyltransferase n=1 Tax=Paracoccus albicereus TaxID=2922394 RepID=A0ABT1MQM5_9RHOB|nr:diaminobutyrate acetyltransferase [Paracoccus albicereus]MCQ0969633.1 diaminobutyrate acetyltransferase [Paracoccus albicereus]